MAYIGREPVNGFHAKQTLSTDGSTVTFTLDFSVADETSIIVSVGGVLQEPKVAYNLAAGGTQITFTAAPAATDTAYIHYLGQSIVQNLVDLNGVALVLDADADTTIAADTDDQIDIQIAGADDFQFTANKFSVLTGSSQSFADSAKGLFGTGDDLEIYHDGTNSYIANKTGALKIATETSGIALTIGHTTSETTVADNLTVTGNLTVGGTTSFGDFDITNVGSIALDTITNDGTDITLDSSADIVIDAAGGNIEFKDAGTLQLTLDMDGTAGAQVIQLGVDSDDLIFKQYDGTTVLTLDDDTTVKVATDLTIGDDASLISDAAVLNFGANSEIKLTHVHDTGLLLTDSGGSPTLQLHDANESVSSDGSKLILTSNGVALSLPTADGSSGQALVTNGSGVLSFSAVSSNTPTSADGQALGSASLEWSDLFLADAGTIQFGNDQDVTLTHVADTGLLLNTASVIQFRDSAINIGSPADGDLDINADDEVEINSTLIDVNGNLDVSGTIVGASTLSATTGTFSGILKTDDATDATSGTDGSLQTDGGLSVVKDAVIGNDLLLLSDASVIKFGADSEITLTHVHNAGLILGGTTPTLTIGDAGAEDAKIVFDGNAQDFHIGLDDSADDLIIGKGSALGTTPAITVNENLETNIANIQNPENPFRNIIINGNMEVAQRATSTSGITSDGFYSVDRFNLGIGSFGTWTQSQVADAPAGYGLTKALKMDCTTAQGSPGSSALITFDYAIEGQNLQRGMIGTANAQKICLTFFHKHTKTGINTVELLDADNNDAVSGSYTQSVSNTWEKATIIFPAKTSGAFDDDNNRSLRVRICLGAGTDSTSGTLATTWQSSITNANRHAGQVNNADSTSNNFIITGVQLEFGDRPTDFEHVPFDVNLLRCQRYLSKMKQNGSGNNIRFCSGVCTSGTASELAFIVYPQLRATPSLTVSGTPAHYRIRSENARDASGISNDNRHINGVNIQGAVSSGQTAGFSANLDAQNAAAEVTLDAEM